MRANAVRLQQSPCSILEMLYNAYSMTSPRCPNLIYYASASETGSCSHLRFFGPLTPVNSFNGADCGVLTSQLRFT